MNHSDPDAIMAQVDALLARRRTTHARTLLQGGLAAHPNHSGLMLQAAWTDYYDDRNEDALRAVRHVLVAEPHDSSARLLYFALMVDAQKYADAERAILDLLREYPENATYYGLYANLMLDTLNLGKARRLAAEGLRYDPDDSECLAAITICDFIERRAGAPSDGLKRLLVNNPDSLRTLVLVLVAMQERGQRREAYRLSRELVRLQPDNTAIAEMARQLKIATHWSMIPMWPMQRFGWGGSVGVWLFAVFGINAVGRVDPRFAAALMIVFLIYIVYSWTWPPLLRRLIRP